MNTLRESRAWWISPEWLSKPPSAWPTDPSGVRDACGEQTRHLQPEGGDSQHSGVLLQGRKIQSPFYASKFRSLKKVLRFTVQVIRFIARCHRVQRSFPVSITDEERDRAEISWIRHTQSEAFTRQSEIQSPFYASKFRSLQKVLRVTLQMIRFFARCRRVHRSFPVSITKMDRAEISWIRHTQTEAFTRELHFGVANGSIGNLYYVTTAQSSTTAEFFV